MSAWADLAALGYVVTDAGTGPVAVAGFGLASMYDRDDDAALAALLDPAGHAERRFQATQPDAAAARAELELAGYTIARVDPSSDTFEVVPPASAALMAATAPATMTPAELVAAAAELEQAIDPAPVSTTPPQPTPLGG